MHRTEILKITVDWDPEGKLNVNLIQTAELTALEKAGMFSLLMEKER